MLHLSHFAAVLLLAATQNMIRMIAFPSAFFALLGLRLGLGALAAWPWVEGTLLAMDLAVACTQCRRSDAACMHTPSLAALCKIVPGAALPDTPYP